MNQITNSYTWTNTNIQNNLILENTSEYQKIEQAIRDNIPFDKFEKILALTATETIDQELLILAIHSYIKALRSNTKHDQRILETLLKASPPQIVDKSIVATLFLLPVSAQQNIRSIQETFKCIPIALDKWKHTLTKIEVKTVYSQRIAQAHTSFQFLAQASVDPLFEQKLFEIAITQGAHPQLIQECVFTGKEHLITSVSLHAMMQSCALMQSYAMNSNMIHSHYYTLIEKTLLHFARENNQDLIEKKLIQLTIAKDNLKALKRKDYPIYTLKDFIKYNAKESVQKTCVNFPSLICQLVDDPQIFNYFKKNKIVEALIQLDTSFANIFLYELVFAISNNSIKNDPGSLQRLKELVAFLLKNGVDEKSINLPDKYNQHLLSYALASEQIWLAHLLLQHGASSDTEISPGRSISKCIATKIIRLVRSHKHLLAGHYIDLLKTLLEYKAHPNPQQHFDKPLLASIFDALFVLSTQNTNEKEKLIPSLHTIMKHILDDKRMNPETKDSEGNPLLHLAILPVLENDEFFNTGSSLFEELLRSGASPEATNNQNMTLVEIVKKRGNLRLAEYLQSKTPTTFCLCIKKTTD